MDSKPGRPSKPLFPLVFCRQCAGNYRVSIVHDEHEHIGPGEDRREEGDDSNEAYLYVSEQQPWPGRATTRCLSDFGLYETAADGSNGAPDSRRSAKASLR